MRIINREKIVNALENCVLDGNCINCEYITYTACKTCIMIDALTLLKEQKPKRPMLRQKGK